MIVAFLCIGCLLVAVTGIDYSGDYVVDCSLIPTESFSANFAYLWDKAVLHSVDRYMFLSICPLLLIVQGLLLKVYYDNPILRQRQGAVFMAIVIFEVFDNVHLFITGIYYTVHSDNQPIPDSFTPFCLANSFIYSFIEILHIQFLILFPSYIVYILRFTLKPSKFIVRVVFIGSFLLALGSTVLLWWGRLIGLNIFGLCEMTFIREPSLSLVPLIVISVFTVVFLVVGIFTVNYFKKHMPDTVGLRYKKYQQNKLLMYYIVGYGFFQIVSLAINIAQLVNCESPNPSSSVLPLVTVFNGLRVLRFIYIFFILFNNLQFKRVFKKYIKRVFSKNGGEDRSDHQNSSFRDENFDFEEFFLEIKDEKNEIDLLKMSQVLTIVSGIFIAYKQYYNISDQHFPPTSPMKKNSIYSAQSFLSQERANQTRKIFYHEKMSILLDAEIVKDYIIDYSLIPQLGILRCQMIIHAPKIFQQLLANDRLENIYNSFQMHQNTKKMFDLVEGQGGRSGEFFFFSYDNKYVLKTITPGEFHFIEKNLSFFYEHFKRNPDSLLSKIYGLFTFKGDEMQRTYHLIMMKNILGCRKEQVLRTYDLKGSKDNREVAGDEAIEANELRHLTLKDIDFTKLQQTLKIDHQFRDRFREVVHEDSVFLKNLNIVDYSLLVVKVKWATPPPNPQFWGQLQRMPAVGYGAQEKVYYHIGIIDILQRWDIQKNMEKWWKNLLGKKDISAQDPKKYQVRFVHYMRQITAEVYGPRRSQRAPSPICSEEEDQLQIGRQQPQPKQNQFKRQISKEDERQNSFKLRKQSMRQLELNFKRASKQKDHFFLKKGSKEKDRNSKRNSKEKGGVERSNSKEKEEGNIKRNSKEKQPKLRRKSKEKQRSSNDSWRGLEIEMQYRSINEDVPKAS